MMVLMNIMRDPWVPQIFENIISFSYLESKCNGSLFIVSSVQYSVCVDIDLFIFSKILCDQLHGGRTKLRQSH